MHHDAVAEVPASESLRWITPAQLRRLVRTSDVLHFDIRELLALLAGQVR